MYTGSWPRPWRTTATRRALVSARPTLTGGAARCGFMRYTGGMPWRLVGHWRCLPA